jgi:hypothetical protein
MYVEIDGQSIQLEIRCTNCDGVIYVVGKSEYSDILVVEVEEHTCEED